MRLLEDAMKLKALAHVSLIVLITSFSLTAYAQEAGARAQRVRSSNPPRGALAVTTSGNWPQSRFDPAQTGYNPDESILSRDTIGNLVLDWQYIYLDYPESYNSAVVADNMLFFSGMYEFDALNATTGTALWEAPIERTAAPAVVNGIVYVGGPDGNLYALNESTGAILWQYPTGDSITASPTVANGIAYVGSQDHYFYALNATTGTLLWRYPTAVAIGASPAVANGMVYFGCDNVYALNATTGALMWKSPFAVGTSSPAVANGVIYVGSSDNFLYALDAGTGALIWKYLTGGVTSSPAVANGVVYLGSRDRNLYAINATTGAFIWKFATGNYVASSPAVANGIVYFASTDKNMYAVDANTGAVLWDYWTGSQIAASPVVANGMVYLPIGETMSAFHLPGEIPPGFSVIHSFDQQSGSADAGVTLRNGVLYGVTGYSATGPIAFQMVPWGDRWTYQPIATLTNGSDANSRLIFGPDGNPYGTTYYNNNNNGGYGLVYNLTPESLNGPTAKQWHENVLYEFQGSPDGAYPSHGDLLWGQQGHIYGTTTYGGLSNNGTVYELTCSGKICTEQVLYSFAGGTDGSNPQNGVVFDSVGNLYGTTAGGGLYSSGTVFELKYNNGSWTETVLYNFTGENDGGGPEGGVIFDNSGNLYGSTASGGSGNQGTLFELSPSGEAWAFSLLYSFPSEIYAGCGPSASLVINSAGNLYGTTACGDPDDAGNLFELTKTGGNWTYTDLGDGFGGVFPDGMLAIDANGLIYGTTSSQTEHEGGPGSVWIFKQ